MTKHYFQELAEEQGWTVVDNVAFGEADGFPFRLTFDTGDGALFTIRFAVDGATRAIAKAFKENRQEQITWYAGDDEAGGRLTGVADLPSDFYAKGALHTLMHHGPQALREAGLHPPENCPLCGLPGCDATAGLDNASRPTHAACLDTRLDLPEDDHKTPVRIRGHWVTGVLGAIVGGLFAALPNWATALSKGTVSAVLYAFIPVAAALLYRLFRGKAKLAPSGLIVLAASLLVAVALEPVWYWVTLSEQMGYGISLAESTALLLAAQSIPNLLRGMWLSLLFLIAGFFPAMVLLRGYAQDGTIGGETVRGARFVRASKRPWPPKKEEKPAKPAEKEASPDEA